MSTVTKTENKKPVEERVEIFVPRTGSKDDVNMFVSINGVNYLLPRGKTHSVPVAVAEEIKRSLNAQERYEATAESQRYHQ